MLYSHVALLVLRVFALVHKSTGGNDDYSSGTETKVARINGHFVIGALFPVHRQAAGVGCGEIWEQYGIQRTEIALETVRRINKYEDLPFKLGITVRDSCWSEQVVMERTIDFIRESGIMASPSEDQCLSGGDDEEDKSLVVAVMGPGKSSTTIATQNLLQIGYSATSTDLSDKEQFKYFLRVVPNDEWQARAMVEIVRQFKWTYVTVIYSSGNYGEKGFEKLKKYIDEEEEICMASAEKISSLDPLDDYEDLLLRMNKTDDKNRSPKVIICFCEGETIKLLFQAEKKLHEGNININFQIVGSESWADRQDVVEGAEEQAAGSFSIRIHSPAVKWFDSYYFNLSLANNRANNPWFEEFWKQKFGCAGSECNGKENLTMDYTQDPKLSQVINSIHTIKHALVRLHTDLCPNDISEPCRNMNVLLHHNRSLIYEYMTRKVNFTDEFDQEIYFDKNGDPPARYDILNYRGKAQGFLTVGEFRNFRNGTHALSVPKDAKVTFYDGTFRVPKSVCSEPCRIGYKRNMQPGSCCWACIPCAEREFLKDPFTCELCPDMMWPLDNKTDCQPVVQEYMHWYHPAALLAETISLVGIVLTLITLYVFIKKRTTPVVKATTRELSYIILTGIIICYTMAFVIVAKPTTYTCYVVRTVPGVAFSMIYGALLTKTNRIARILAGSKKRILTKKPRFLSTTSQVVITWLLVGVELVIVIAFAVEDQPRVGHEPSIPAKNLTLVCTVKPYAFLAPFGWDLLLITLCTLYAIKTRNLPENFNEAKFIGFTMYTTCIIWVAFITIYFGSPNKAITMCLSFNLSATVALVLLFFPKIYIIIFHPEKNIRQSTTKIIRCHFGTNPSSTAGGTLASGGHDRQGNVNRTLSSKTSTRLSAAQDSSGSTSGSDLGQTGEVRQRRPVLFRDSLHVPIPRPSAIASARVTSIVSVEEEEDDIGSNRRRMDAGPLSVIEETGLSTTDSKAMVRSSSSTRIAQDRACQTEVSLLEDLLRLYEKSSATGNTNKLYGKRQNKQRPSIGIESHKRALSLHRYHRGSKSEELEQDVQDLIDSCTRYQEAKALKRVDNKGPLLRKASSANEEEFIKLLAKTKDDPKERRRDSRHLAEILANSGMIDHSVRAVVGPVGTERASEIIRRSSIDQTRRASKKYNQGKRPSRDQSSSAADESPDAAKPFVMDETSRSGSNSSTATNTASLGGRSILGRLSYSIRRKVVGLTSPTDDHKPTVPSDPLGKRGTVAETGQGDAIVRVHSHNNHKGDNGKNTRGKQRYTLYKPQDGQADLSEEEMDKSFYDLLESKGLHATDLSDSTLV